MSKEEIAYQLHKTQEGQLLGTISQGGGRMRVYLDQEAFHTTTTACEHNQTINKQIKKKTTPLSTEPLVILKK